MSRTRNASIRALIATLVGAAASVSYAQNAFTYQGSLMQAGAPANGTYDMRFTLWTDQTIGAPDTQVGSTVTSPATQVTDGLFQVPLDLDDAAFQHEFVRYLQIEVRPAGGGAYTTLNPRTPIRFAPRAFYAINANNAQVAQGLDLPITANGSDADLNAFGALFHVSQFGTTGYAIRGDGKTAGVLGLVADYTSSPPVPVGSGVAGISRNTGVFGGAQDGAGIKGSSISGYGGEFTTVGANSAVPLWAHTSGTNNAAVIEIDNSSSFSSALLVHNASTQASAFATHSIIESTSPGGSSAAVRGENRGTGGLGIGVWGSQAGSGWGVYGTSTNGGRGVYGFASGSGGYGVYATGTGGADAGFFFGNVTVTGTLSKGSGTFKIDHPNDPANMYLSHSFVESPDMKNIYDGVVTLDEQGNATVTMPSYFDALNTEFRYQLTCIGGYAPVYIAQEINEREFVIAGGSPGLKVSWQITGIRHDPFALANPVRVEEEKSSNDKGHYLHPELYGQPQEKGIGYTQQPPLKQN